MGILLARAKSAAELLTASKAVRAGAHGDHTDWIAAQERWLHTQSSLLDGLTAEPLAFPIEIAHTAIMRPGWRGGLPWLDDFRALPDVKVEQRAALASRMLWVMARAGSSPDARIQMSAVIDVIKATQQGARRLEIGILDADQDDPSELGTLLESLRDGVRLVYRRQPNDYLTKSPRVDAATLERLERYAIEHPSARSIEALAVAMASMDTPQESIAPVPLDETDSVAHASAVFIALITGERSIAPRELGRRFAAAADNTSWALLHSPRVQSAPDWAEFLVGLHDAIPRTWGRHAYIDRMISEVLSKREAPLADAETWRALDLPAPHPFALTEQQ